MAKVLVIDDEKLLGQTIQLGLEDVFDVEIETSGRAGLQRLLQGDEVQLVLCDLSLPDLSGVEIHREVAEKRPELLPRFVVMTGGAISTASRDFLERFDGPLLNKPFTLGQVEELVTRLLP